jgi:hypothetical protein
MSCEGVKLFSEKVHGPCWGLFQKWKSSWAMQGSFSKMEKFMDDNCNSTGITLLI